MSERHQAIQDRQDFYNHYVNKSKAMRSQFPMALAFVDALLKSKVNNNITQRIGLQARSMF